VRVARKARPLRETHHRRAAAGFVVAKQAALDAGISPLRPIADRLPCSRACRPRFRKDGKDAYVSRKQPGDPDRDAARGKREPIPTRFAPDASSATANGSAASTTRHAIPAQK
jgi:hypothetical protein